MNRGDDHGRPQRIEFQERASRGLLGAGFSLRVMHYGLQVSEIAMVPPH